MVTRSGSSPNPVVKSTEGSTTRPCREDVQNSSQCAGLDHEGTEKKYASIPTGGQFPQGTYTTHAWRIRESGSGRLLGTYVGEEATIEMTPAAACIVHKGFSSGYNLSRKKSPGTWGAFKQRGEAKGIAIRAFDCVCNQAVDRAEHIVTHMMENMPKPMVDSLLQNAADVAIIGRHQVVSDMPMHSFLAGQDMEFGQRDYDCGCRGVGGSWTVPTCSVGEENLTMEGDSHYPSEDILVHEFAHSVMAIGMNEDQRQAVMGSYFNARANQLYKSSCYMLASADEYWAEGAQSWFEATARTDVNDRINTRKRIKQHDPQLAALLEKAFGDGEWRFQQTSPSALHNPNARNKLLEQPDLLRLQSRAARYSLCCLPSLTRLWTLYEIISTRICSIVSLPAICRQSFHSEKIRPHRAASFADYKMKGSVQKNNPDIPERFRGMSKRGRKLARAAENEAARWEISDSEEEDTSPWCPVPDLLDFSMPATNVEDNAQQEINPSSQPCSRQTYASVVAAQKECNGLESYESPVPGSWWHLCRELEPGSWWHLDA